MSLYPKSLPVRIKGKYRETIPVFLHIADHHRFPGQESGVFLRKKEKQNGLFRAHGLVAGTVRNTIRGSSTLPVHFSVKSP